MQTLIEMTNENVCRPDRRELDSLLSQIGEGSLAALEELYRRTRAAVYSMALSYLKNAEEAQDVAQETFVRIWENAAMYRSQGSPMAWILTIARNLSLMKLRLEVRQSSLSEDEWNAIPADTSAVSLEDRQMLQDALSALSDEERQIVLLHAVTGLKHREIAALTELPLSTVLSKYRRALNKLRLQLEGDNIL